MGGCKEEDYRRFVPPFMDSRFIEKGGEINIFSQRQGKLLNSKGKKKTERGSVFQGGKKKKLVHSRGKSDGDVRLAQWPITS